MDIPTDEVSMRPLGLGCVASLPSRISCRMGTTGDKKLAEDGWRHQKGPFGCRYQATEGCGNEFTHFDALVAVLTLAAGKEEQAELTLQTLQIFRTFQQRF